MKEPIEIDLPASHVPWPDNVFLMMETEIGGTFAVVSISDLRQIIAVAQRLNDIVEAIELTKVPGETWHTTGSSMADVLNGIVYRTVVG